MGTERGIDLAADERIMQQKHHEELSTISDLQLQLACDRLPGKAGGHSGAKCGRGLAVDREECAANAPQPR